MDKGLKLITEKTIVYKTYRFNFDNSLAYIEKKANNRVQDCYFAEKEHLFPDGTLKPDGNKYFYCANSFDVKKTNKPVNCLKFEDWDNLYFISDDGRICRRDGEEIEVDF